MSPSFETLPCVEAGSDLLWKSSVNLAVLHCPLKAEN